MIVERELIDHDLLKNMGEVDKRLSSFAPWRRAAFAGESVSG